MSKVCARPLCAEVATVRFSFEAEGRFIVLDRKLDEWGGSGVLCEVHADRLTVPRGWQLDDRRISAPRLFRVANPAAPKAARLSRAKKLLAPAAHPSTPLPLDGGPSYALPEEYTSRDQGDPPPHAPRAQSAADAAENAEPSTRSGAPAADRRTPLLARAFDNAASRVRTTSTLDSLIPRAANS